MSDKLDRFTKRARRVLTLAQEEALRLNHNYIGTEHLLLGLVREENGVAVKVLRELGVEPGQVIRAIERTVGRGERAPFGKPTLAPRTKRVIELAVDEARLMGHHYIGTEHLLLGLVREGEGIAVNVLRGTRHQSGPCTHSNCPQHPPKPSPIERKTEERIQDAAG